MTKRVFVYDLPYGVRKALCRVLDASDKWEELGGRMKIPYIDLQFYRRKDSPTDEILTIWGNQNHTVDELFLLLSAMQHYRAMDMLKGHVTEQYHFLLRKGEEHLNQEIENSTETRERQIKTGRLQPVKPCTNTFQDNKKDIGLDVKNMNVAEEINKTKTKNIPEVKQSNLQKDNTQKDKLQLDIEKEVSVPKIEFQELEDATNNWMELNILGRGGFGTVFKGIWKNTPVAVKRLTLQNDAQKTTDYNTTGIPLSQRELKYMSFHRHVNILPLYGYSVKDDCICLVYQLMENGSLEDRLQCKPMEAFSRKVVFCLVGGNIPTAPALQGASRESP